MASYVFTFDDSAWLPYLRERGYVVIKGAVSPNDVAVAKDQIWKDIEKSGNGNIRRSDPSTWKGGGWGFCSSGIVASLAQTAGPWTIRGSEGVQRVFARIWEVQPSELVTSMDAVLLWRPWWQRGRSCAKTGQGFEHWPSPVTEGLHVDQSPFNKPDLECVQGMVPLLPVTPQVGGLEVVPFSHTAEEKKRFMSDHPELQFNGDWCPLPPRSPHGKGAILLEADPGDLILWDSRTIHGGKVGSGLPVATDEGFLPAPDDLARMSVTVAMTPRSMANENVQRHRLEGFEAGRSFNHCPHEAGTSTGTISTVRLTGCAPFELSETQRQVL